MRGSDLNGATTFRSQLAKSRERGHSEGAVSIQTLQLQFAFDGQDQMSVNN